MSQYLILVHETIEGKPVSCVLQLTEDAKLSEIGQLTLVIENYAYSSVLTKECLNKDIIWDELYKDSLRSIFKKNNKHFTLSFVETSVGGRLQIRSEITKGIRIVLLVVNLRLIEGKPAFDVLSELFQKMSQEKLTQRCSLTNQLKKLEDTNSLLEREQKILEMGKMREESELKINFLRQINDVKLRIRRKWPDLTRKSLHEMVKEIEKVPKPVQSQQLVQTHDIMDLLN